MVTYDTRNIYTIPVRVGGRLEKVYLKYPFQQIRKGQKVAEIYSPEMLTAQRELIFLLENDSGNSAMIASAEEKLRLMGASESQINTLIKNKEPDNKFTLYSPYDGYVIPEDQTAPVAPTATPSQSAPVGEGMGMSVPSASAYQSSSSPDDDLIREGSYVTSGQTLFKIAGDASLRVELNLPAASVSTMRKGSEITLDFGKGDKQNAVVDFIQPFFNQGQEFVTIRVYTHHTDNLHIGHLVNAEIKGSSIESMWVPREAVLDLGVDKVVFIKTENVLKPKKIVTGVRTDNEVEVKQGLSSSDEIAANAQYLVDSESFIKTSN
jgi:hypothetical protein